MRAILPLLCFLTACGTEPADWDRARTADTVGAYEEYLARNPAGAHSADATARIADEQDWKKATERGEVADYETYRSLHARGAHVADAQAAVARLEETAAWEKARDLNSSTAYRDYLTRFRDGTKHAEAREWLGSATYEAVGPFSAGVLGRYESGRIRYVEVLELSTDAKIDGRPAKAKILVKAKGGTIDRNDGGLHRDPSLELEVAGNITFEDESGQLVVIAVEDVYVPPGNDLLSAWLVLRDLRFGRTDVTRLCKSRKLATKIPGHEADPDAKVTLLAINGLHLVR